MVGFRFLAMSYIGLKRDREGEAVLSKLVMDGHITPAGMDWLKAVTDPFHDEKMKLAGYPDAQAGKSVVLRNTATLNIAKPQTLNDGNWQVLIHNNPWLNKPGTTTNLQGVTINGGLVTLTGSTSTAWPVSVYMKADGTDIGPFNFGAGVDLQEVTGLQAEPAFSKGPHRLIAMGMEVCDTTAVIDKQGTCTVFRMNQTTESPEVGFRVSTSNFATTPAVNNVVTVTGAVQYQKVRRPPKNLTEANFCLGTASWKSEEGCYLVPTLNSAENKARQTNFTQPLLIPSDVQNANPAAGISPECYLGTELVAFNASSIHPNNWDFVPFHTSGCLFTGLAESATLRLNVVWYIERMPSPDEPDISLLCGDTVPFDPFALHIYNLIMGKMPPGTVFSGNFLGSWFWDAVKQVGLPLLQSIPHPLAQGASMIGKHLVEYLEPKKKKFIENDSLPHNPHVPVQALKAQKKKNAIVSAKIQQLEQAMAKQKKQIAIHQQIAATGPPLRRGVQYAPPPPMGSQKRIAAPRPFDPSRISYNSANARKLGRRRRRR